jgi:hypothetical protein
MSRKILEKSALFGAIDCVCCCLVRGFHWLFIGWMCERAVLPARTNFCDATGAPVHGMTVA